MWLYCTTRLLDRLPADDTDPAPATAWPEPPARLGHWTATLLVLRPARLVLAVSEHDHVPLVLDGGRELAALPAQLPLALYRLLLALDVPPELARIECQAMQPMVPRPIIAGQPSRALGPLKLLGTTLRTVWQQGLSRSPDELALHLAQQASEHLEGRSPAQSARRRLRLSPDQTEALGL